MTHTLLSGLVLVLVAFITPSFANDGDRGEARKRVEPEGLVYGAGLGLSREIYKGYDTRVVPIPFIGYRGKRWRIFGPFVSYDLSKVGPLNITFTASPRFQGFDPSDSDVFAGMAARKSSMDAGLGLRYQRNDWNGNVSVLRDVLGRSNGLETKASIGRVKRFGPIFVEPSLSLSRLDASHVDYYYGVRLEEAAPGRRFYEGGPATNLSAGISVSTPIFFGGFTRVALSHTWFDTSISDSPLVEDDSSLSMMLLFSKFF